MSSATLLHPHPGRQQSKSPLVPRALTGFVPVTVVVLAHNERAHIRRALRVVRDWAWEVFVVDSGSTDGTQAIAEEEGARVFCRPLTSFGEQREWALRALPFETDWMLFLDADEVPTEELKLEISNVLRQDRGEHDGYFIKRRFFWMDRWLRHGGLYPTWILRLVRHKKASLDGRRVNEHLCVEGNTGYLRHDLLHIDVKPLSDWQAKHTRYSSLEAAEERSPGLKEAGRLFGSQRERRRWLRQHLWNRLLPPVVRPFSLFFYRYVLRLGFLDGTPGLVYHTMHCLGYRMAIEAKIMQAVETEGEAPINNRHNYRG